MPDQVLAFLIDAPMQSWGVSSRFQRRDTDSWPSKSALIGVIAAAAGIDKEDPEEQSRLAPFASLLLTVYRWNKIHPSLRLSDFHTIGGGWDKDDPVQRLSIPRKASGGPFGTVVTHRTYLTDARFIALFEGPAAVITEAAAALENPRWGIWFGRKTCVPAAPLSPVVADHEEAALSALAERIHADSSGFADLEGVTERPGDGAWYPQDQPLAFGRHHAPVAEPYAVRPVRRIRRNKQT